LSLKEKNRGPIQKKGTERFAINNGFNQIEKFKNIIVFGGSGFLGSHICDCLTDCVIK
jgi:nucleoside-diphosphate-sugar epimerase